ncbi:uncharacterized protein LOC131158237 isoform X1 [Malania oleifera]|uniref:uncharacterized protein LOC131158237 isoform X1 n=1 Tax=Malania oleifera TaxID=397392 RepID=UPI0025ADA00A|nr:uncharacterized protein LOC131158237 isoform X1 [Malania oleifera]
MSSILSSQGVVLATAMAVSGTVIFLALSRQKTNFPSPNLSGNHNSQPSSRPFPRSCLCSGRHLFFKKIWWADERRRERKKKKVRFAENVKDPVGNGEEFRTRKERRKSVEVCRNCRTEEIPGIGRMPANRVALYNGILRDRVHRIDCSF